MQDGNAPTYHFQLKGGKTAMKGNDPNRFLFDNGIPLRCPVSLTDAYFRILGPNFQGPVVPLCKSGHPNSPSLQPQPYSSALKNFRELLRKVNVDPTGYSEHSMRRGGATEASKAGASTQEIQEAGDWHTSKTALKYIHNKMHTNKNFNKFLQ